MAASKMYRHTTMNMISSFFLLATITSLQIDLSEQFRWNTKSRTIQGCKGNTMDLRWEFDEEGSKIGKLEWYFNDTQLICIKSDTNELKLDPLYQERVEILGKSTIRLKNISVTDEGRYTLFPVFLWFTSDSVQTISLQVKEPPSDKCRSKINFHGHSSILSCDIPSLECGRPQMTAVWKRSKTLEVLGEGNYIVMNSSFIDQEILCCPQGIAMDCVDNVPNTLCTSFLLQNDEIASTIGNNLMQGHLSRNQVPNCSNTDCREMSNHDIVILLAICVTMSSVGTAVSFVSIRFICKIVKTNRDLEKNLAVARNTMFQAYLTEVTEKRKMSKYNGSKDSLHEGTLSTLLSQEASNCHRYQGVPPSDV